MHVSAVIERVELYQIEGGAVGQSAKRPVGWPKRNEPKFHVLFVFVSASLKPDLNCAAILVRSSLYAPSHVSQQN